MTNTNVASITIKNDVQVTIPASPRFMTTFILLEQNDWFEDEIKFIRHFIKPGMKVVDIGANFGLYTLSIANIIGDSGKIWAFEPTSSTAACLRKSISSNRFNNIELIQAGLSNRLGEARLFKSPNSELNSLSRDASPDGQYETVPLFTLDYCREKYSWECIDFIKLDAEKEESNILEKGGETLSSLSPLIMYELKHDESVNLHLVSRFRAFGYNSYRLVPGLNILVPFDENEPADEFLLNLFCCKEDKARQLEEEGIIVRSWEENKTIPDAAAKEFIEALPYGKALKKIPGNQHNIKMDAYISILNMYVMAHSKTESSSSRAGFLMESLNNLRDMMDQGAQSIERTVTFSRIAFDAGERKLGVELLLASINKLGENINQELSESFLPASRKYDGIDPVKGINEWLLSSMLEEYIVKHAYSSYFTGSTTLSIFAGLEKMGYMDENMKKRFSLVKSCFSR